MDGEQVDEVARLRQELAETQERLHAARGQMATLVSRLSHDLHNALGTVRGFADLLVTDTADAPHLRSSAERIARAADRSLEVVAAAANEARATVTAHAPDRIDLVALAEEVAAELRAEGVTTFQLHHEGRPPPIPGMRSKLRRVIRELLLNAATHASGATVTVRADRSGDRLTVTFSDDGPGAATVDLDRLLQPGTTLAGAGPGQGLATVRRLLEEHAGKVWLTSPPGGGLAVHLALPDPGPEAGS